MAHENSNIDHYEKQFGIIAIEKGYITSEMLIEGLKIQVEEEIEFHTHRLIGEILMEKDYITAMQIQEILNTIFKHKP
jgi:flagellar basal body P-ring protein FlgI